VHIAKYYAGGRKGFMRQGITVSTWLFCALAGSISTGAQESRPWCGVEHFKQIRDAWLDREYYLAEPLGSGLINSKTVLQKLKLYERPETGICYIEVKVGRSVNSGGAEYEIKDAVDSDHSLQATLKRYFREQSVLEAYDWAPGIKTLIADRRVVLGMEPAMVRIAVGKEPKVVKRTESEEEWEFVLSVPVAFSNSYASAWAAPIGNAAIATGAGGSVTTYIPGKSIYVRFAQGKVVELGER
jgi:hypothetical protein